jgi:PKD repeat protein
MKTIKFLSRFLMLGIILISTGCADDDKFTAYVPTSEDAAYTFTFDTENPNKVIFTANTEVETWYTHWDFGDNSSAEGMEASKIYLKKGDYDVRFKIFTVGGEAEFIQTIVIVEDFKGQNILLNGEFNGSDHWTVLPISDGVDVNFTGDKAVWTGGSWGQEGIYQPVHVEANVPYQIDMDIAGSGLSDSWYEVYIGVEVPEPGQDYADGGARLGLNTWNGCGAEPFEGLLTEISCVGEGGGLVTFNTTGTVYLVIRGGGADYGTGLSLYNVSMIPLVPGIVITPPKFPPIASFTVAKSGLEATFTNTSYFGESYLWDFGDGEGTSTEENPTYTYTAEGTYTVKLTVSNTDGSDEVLTDVTFGASLNLINNGTFTDDSGWTIVNQYEAANTNGSVTIADGVATFNETTSSDWKHMGIYTSVELEPGTYQFDMDMTYTSINDIWGEVYIGASQPFDNSEYSGDQQVLKAYNAWDCGGIKTYSGSAIASGCDGSANPGQFEITSSGTYYILFRTGGGTYGTTGIVIDNMSLLKI